MVSGLNQAGCATPSSAASSSSSSHLTSVIGGVVGSILGALILIALLYWYIRRKQNAKAEAAHRLELNSEAYTLGDGTAPKITPFMVDHQDEEYCMVPSSSDHSPFRDSPSPGRDPYSTLPSTRSPYSSNPPLPPYPPHPSRPHYEPTTHSSQPSNASNTYSSDSGDPFGSMDARTGLANPDAFSYRT
ncbi:hypothetical protein P7C70_g1326, partial [Phenoliferia sp. Uapishka_3]